MIKPYSPTVRREQADLFNTVSESTVSNTKLSEFLVPHRVLGRELSEFLSAYYLCAKANSPSFSQNSPSLPQNSVTSLFRNSTLEQYSACFLVRGYISSKTKGPGEQEAAGYCPQNPSPKKGQNVALSLPWES